MVDTVTMAAYHRAPMSQGLTDRVDIARQVQAGRLYEGALPLARLPRLRGSLASTDGAVRYRVEFGKDGLGVSFIALQIEADLPLTCQRTLETFIHPVSIEQRLGVMAQESDESALPADYEPLLAPNGDVSIADVIEDELILALPVVPLKPGVPLEWIDPLSDDGPDEQAPGPFALLGSLKKH